VGNVLVTVFHTPGHTPEHLSFLITDEGAGADEAMGMISGDFVFVGDTGRPDLLESAAGVEGAMREGAHALYRSVRRFLALPDYLQLWPGHGAGSACGKALGAVPESTVGYERRFSPAMAAAGQGEDAFVSYVLDAQPEPPLYFGRMKRLNRDGPALLESLPSPARLAAGELAGLAGRKDVAVVDTRSDRSAFMRSHLTGSLYAPLDRTFPTVTGSYLDPDVPVHLLVEEGRLAEAIRALIRVGIDRIEGWAPFETLDAAAEAGAKMASTDEIDISEIEPAREGSGSVVLDVRRLAEHLEGGVAGSLHVPHTRLAERLGELPREKRLLVHCRTGARSAVAAAFLERQGFDVVYVNGTLAAASDHAPSET
jgi:hydroxyacylglutathione hydrolase